MKNKKGFTLVELLAVIVILAIVLVIAVPKVMSVIEDSKKATLESTAKMIASAAEKAKVQNTVLGKETQITCDSVAKITDIDYEDCDIDFDDNTAKVTIKGSGKFDGLYICNGTKVDASATDEECSGSGINENSAANYITGLLAKESTLHNGLVQTYATVNGKQVDAGIRYAGPLTGDNAVKNQVYFNCDDECTSGDKTIKYGDEDYAYKDHCEVWRIIGVFNTKSSDNASEEPVPRIKIVRNEVLSTNMKWDTTSDEVSYINQWGETTLTSDDTTIYSGASLKQYLNDGEESYYNSLTSIAKGQMGDVLWYTGAVLDGTASEVYEDERSNATSKGTSLNYTTKWIGKVGLIYPSDFGYAGTNCGDKTISYYDESCGVTSNWLTSSSVSYWTISPYATNKNYSFEVEAGGYAIYSNVATKYYVRPTLYLKSSIEIIGGNGTDDYPYVLSIPEQ